MMQSGLRAFQLLLGVAAVGGSIAAWQDAPRPVPPAEVSRQLPAGALTLPAVYIDAPPIVVLARGARAATATVHVEVPPIVVRGRKPAPVRPATRVARQPCLVDREGC